MKLRSVEKISTGSCLLESEEGEEDLCAIFSGLEAHTSEMLQDFLLYTRSLEYEQEPDYAYLKGLVQKVGRNFPSLSLSFSLSLSSSRGHLAGSVCRN
jgi:hypothetical protein